MRYKVLLTTELEIEADNVAQAFKVMDKVRVIHPLCGSSRNKHDRDRLSWQIKTVDERFFLRRKR